MRVPTLFAIMLVGVIAAFVTASTGAVFTDLATSSGNTFTAGTVDIKLANGSGVSPTFQDSVSAQFSMSGNMAPGDGEVIETQVKNAGSLSLRYALSLTPAGTPLAIAAWAQITGGANFQVTTSRPHALTAGEMVTFSGTGVSALDGTPHAVAIASPTIFTFARANETTPLTPGVATSGLGVAISGSVGSWIGGGTGPVTVTTLTPHGFVVGEVVQISGAAGTNYATFNNQNFTLTAVGTFTFTFADPGVSAASLTGGTVSTYGPLLSVLKWKIMSGGGCTPGAEPYTGVTAFDNTGAFIVNPNTQAIGSAGGADTDYQLLSAILSTPSTDTNGRVFGNPAWASPWTGDRTLTPGQTEALCIKVILPKDTPGSPGQTPASGTPGYQGVAGTINFKFDAEQTANT